MDQNLAEQILMSAARILPAPDAKSLVHTSLEFRDEVRKAGGSEAEQVVALLHEVVARTFPFIFWRMDKEFGDRMGVSSEARKVIDALSPKCGGVFRYYCEQVKHRSPDDVKAEISGNWKNPQKHTKLNSRALKRYARALEELS